MRATYPIIREFRGGSAESAIEFLRCNSVFFEVGGIAQTTARCPTGPAVISVGGKSARIKPCKISLIARVSCGVRVVCCSPIKLALAEPILYTNNSD
jgi:hypothetical protein